MPVDKSRYRRVEYIGARILQGRELNKAQRITRHLDDSGNPASYGDSAVYRTGATLNVTVGISNKDVTLSATDGAKPMLVFVGDRWEILKTAEAPTVTFSIGETVLYLNWVLKKITVAQDSDLQDLTTLEATAEMGELQLSVSKTDTSGVSLASDEFEKNTSPIILFQFTHSGATVTLNSAINAGTGDKGNVKDQALADGKTAGLVHLSTNTSDGKAAADDDPRLSDARAPLALSVEDSKVRVPVATGNTNADGTPEYTLPVNGGADAGGISAAKIILLAAKQTLEAGWVWLKAKVLAVEADFNSHETASLGLGNTHPFPTAQQVGAAPISHVDLPLGVPGSHPATASMSTGGFRLVRDGAVVPPADDFAFGVQEGVGIKAGLSHDGDVFAELGTSAVIPASDGEGPLTNSGALGHLSTIAAVLAEHVGKVSHNNPHGLEAGDIGAATTIYVDTGDQNVLSSAIAFAELLGSVATRKDYQTSGSYPHNWLREPFLGNQPNRMAWAIFSFGGRLEIAIGHGQIYHGTNIMLPTADANGSWSPTNFFAQCAPASMKIEYDEDSPAYWNFDVPNVPDGSGGYMSSQTVTAFHSSKEKGYNLPQWSSVQAVAWRTITAPPILISLSPSTGTTGATVTITGRNFGSVIGNATVTFGGVAATVTSCTPTQIQATVPAGAATGPITVAVSVSGRNGVNTLTFTKS